jgi:hypothetical protein
VCIYVRENARATNLSHASFMVEIFSWAFYEASHNKKNYANGK